MRRWGIDKSLENQERVASHAYDAWVAERDRLTREHLKYDAREIRWKLDHVDKLMSVWQRELKKLSKMRAAKERSQHEQKG